MLEKSFSPPCSNISKVKAHNLRAVLSVLRHHEAASRAYLAELTGLSTTTISNLVSELLEQGIVTEEGIVKSASRQGAGRPRTALCLVPEARHAIGIHIGVGQIRVAVADLRAHPLNCLSLDHSLDSSSTEVLHDVAALVDEAISQSGVDREQVARVRRTALAVFDRIADAMNLRPGHRLLLGWAADLHEAGLGDPGVRNDQQEAQFVGLPSKVSMTSPARMPACWAGEPSTTLPTSTPPTRTRNRCRRCSANAPSSCSAET